MKSRTVVLTLEVETDLPLPELRRAASYDLVITACYRVNVLQAQANVVKPKPKP